MRKIIALFTTLPVVVSSSFANWVKTNDDEIPIPLEWNESELDTIIWRTPVPISAVVIPSQSVISVTFMNNMGDVSIEISNLFTGEDHYYEESSLSGGAILPFSGSAGYYYIRFRIYGGSSYSGYFSIVE